MMIAKMNLGMGHLIIEQRKQMKPPKPGDVKVDITKHLYPDGWNYYLLLQKYYGPDLGWVVIEGAQKETILSQKKANEVKKELIKKHTGS